MRNGQIQPPWNPPPEGGINFTVPEIENVPDLHGEIENPDLVIFFSGNQFMVVPELIDAFKKQHPQYRRIFVETLPPGILKKQVEQGALIVGNLKITHRPDIFTGGRSRIDRLQKETGWFADTRDYARNRLAIMVREGNPKHIRSLSDLGRPDVHVSMPNPEWEAIAEKIKEAYRKAGGDDLVHAVMEVKKQDGTTFLTQIHHRQTPIRILQGKSDAGPVWYTEPYFQKMIGNPIETVEIPDEVNQQAVYTAASMKEAPHPEAAADFLNFLTGDQGQAIYRKYGFLPKTEPSKP